MHTVVIETPIARSADEVFDYLRDHSNQRTWQAEHVKSVDVDPPGPAKVGTKIHKTRRTPMGELSFAEEVTDLDVAERRWTERTTTGGIQGTEITWRVLPTDSGSTVRLEARFAARGVQRMLLPLIRRSAVKDWHTEFATCRRLLES